MRQRLKKTLIDKPNAHNDEQSYLLMSKFSDSYLGRRDFLRVGSLGLGGLSLPDFLRAEEALKSVGGIAKDKTVIFLFMHGGPSHNKRVATAAAVASATAEQARLEIQGGVGDVGKW